MKTSKKAVVFTHLYNDFSGSPCVLKDAINSIAEDNVERVLFTSQHHGFLSDLKLKKVVIPYFYSSNQYGKILLFALNQLILFLALSACLMKLRLQGKQVKVVVNTILPLAALLAGCFFAHRVVSYVHETSLQSRMLSRVLKLATLRLSHQRLYVSDYVKGHYDDPTGNVVLNGLRSDFEPIESKSELQKVMQEKQTHKNILFVGSLRSYKGFGGFVELAKYYPDMSFKAVINASAAEYSAFKSGYPEWPINLDVGLRPKQLSQYYREAYVLLNLSDKRFFQETFGMTILEGLAFGCPVIVPSCGGHLEFCKPSNSEIADVASLESVRAKLDQFIYDQTRWAEKSYAAWETSQTMTCANYQNQIRPYMLEM